jgi:putative transposase
MSKFQNKYRVASSRLQTWDYSGKGCYFITICTRNKECYFGEIVPVETLPNYIETLHATSKQLKPTPIGIIAKQFWVDIPKHFNNSELGEFVVMPNHVHGIIYIDIPSNRVETLHATSLPKTTSIPKNKNEFMSNISPKPDSLSAIIRSYKSAVTTFARKNHILFDWQTRYHDHIIRNDGEFQRITDYIINNPDNWEKDKFYNHIL